MRRIKIILLILAFSFISGPYYSQEIERNSVDTKLMWNLEDLYENLADWKTDQRLVYDDLERITEFYGKLGESPIQLQKALDLYFSISKRLNCLAVYAYRLRDQDLRVGENQALAQEAANLETKFSENTSFLKPEILTFETEKMKIFLRENKNLEQYQIFLDDIQRLRKHTLSEREEKILASAYPMANAPGNVYTLFNNTEMPYESVKLSTGETVALTPASYTKYRSTDSRDDREKIFEVFFGNYGKFRNTLAANYEGKIQADYFFAKNRKYNSTLEKSLDNSNIPTGVYENLIKQIHDNLPTLHRFLNLKRKMLGLDKLHYYDLYSPIVGEVDFHFTVNEGQELIIKALSPLGQDYLGTMRKAFENRWIDYMPNIGKRSGAYSSGSAYDVHPYILMNWTNDYESVSTLAHELGHTMHSYYSNTNQSFQNSDYETFVAEIASTLNENLLNDYMVKNVKSDEEKIYLLGSYLELLRTTIFRQVLFAEFEWEVHKLVENNKPVTGDGLSDLYFNLVKKYYGHEEGICIVDPYIAYEWAYIPHFIGYDYYVYQYSTSLILSNAFAEKIILEGQPAVDNYFKILKGGGSDYPINLIKKAGLDPLSPEAFVLTMNKMNKVMDQIEKIVD